MSRVVDLYTTQASKIFPRPSFARKWGILDSKYPNDALIEELQSVFGSRSNFAVPSREVRIPSFNLTTGYSKIFRAGRTNSADRNIFTWQVAAATSAAPTYFPAFEIAGCGLFVDGGIWANNPAVVGLIEAMNLKNSPQDIHILSVGTGERSFRSDQNRTGFISWRSDLVELV